MIENCPWTYHYDDCDEYGNGEIHDSCGGFIAITTGPNYGAWHKDGGCHFEGIARLIAAAPELLEALVIARDYAAYAQAEPGDLALIDAAIAKATGK